VQIRPLTGVPFKTLFDCFTLAFSDYLVKLEPSEETLREMFRRRGVLPSLSVGAFDGSQLVGFTVNGIDGNRGYDSGTGVIPTHRRTHLARDLMRASFDVLRTAGVRTYILEVLVQNTAAIALYESLGFTPTRLLQCWTYNATSRTVITELANADLDLIRSWCDFAPSWQNDVPSLRRAHLPYVVLGNEDGAATVFPDTGDLPLLAVRPDARRHGLGGRLLAAAATRANKPLQIVNVDGREEGIAAFLERSGATRLVAQLEMSRPL
jgi:ribosomal protein S18 acetylase RimI-like enzyme